MNLSFSRQRRAWLHRKKVDWAQKVVAGRFGRVPRSMAIADQADDASHVGAC